MVTQVQITLLDNRFRAKDLSLTSFREGLFSSFVRSCGRQTLFFIAPTTAHSDDKASEMC